LNEKNMKICPLADDKFGEFIKFNQQMNPTQNDFEAHFQWQILDNPLLKDRSELPILVAYNGNDEIVGQHPHNPFEYEYQGKRSTGYFGFDYFVAEKCRKMGIGSALAKQAIADFHPHFGVGVSEKSKNILLSLGNRIIGNLFIYIWFSNVTVPIRYALKSIRKDRSIEAKNDSDNYQFPDRVGVDGFSFKKIVNLKASHEHRWSDEILQFSRSVAFLGWRFFKNIDKYAFYLLEEKSPATYFVARTISIKGLKLLAIVDYRIPDQDKDRFNAILKASKHIAKKNGHDGVFTMSSHSFFDKKLARNMFFRIGRPIIILTNADIKISPMRIKKRQFVMATMAESDLDFYFEFDEGDISR
jgi:hypothetical protein